MAPVRLTLSEGGCRVENLLRLSAAIAERYAILAGVDPAPGGENPG